jgi:hypothetical protein
MRTKRDICNSHGTVNAHDNVKKNGKNRHLDNIGEAFVRYITQKNAPHSETPYTQSNDPFGLFKQNTECDNISGNSIENQQPPPSYTKFHLEDDEMLMELMMHLNSDCPDMMRNKQQLLDNVSRVFDKISK